MRLLLVEDDLSWSYGLARGLEREGFVVDVVDDGLRADAAATARAYDAILLDWSLPGKTGVELCRDLRGRGVATPILMVSGRSSVEDRVTGLDSGADDYLVKPFAFQELLARIRSLLRRGPTTSAPVLRVEDLRFDPAAHALSRGGRPIAVTAKEEAILELLLRRAGTVVSRAELCDRVWAGERGDLGNLVDVHMSNLRRKVDGPGERRLLHTVRGRGYRLGPPAQEQPSGGPRAQGPGDLKRSA